MSSERDQAPVGVLAMAYGTPADPGQLEAYYTHIRHGHTPAPALLEELRRRYQAIGGLSPLLAHTRTQVQGLQAALEVSAPGRFRTAPGMKHAPPFLEEGIAGLVNEDVRRIIGLVLAPHYSMMSVGEYLQRARAACPAALPFSAIESWHLVPGYLSYLTDQVLRVKARMRETTGLAERDVHVLFTAHSLPTRILDAGDPYPAQLQETAEAVARLARLPHWSVAWQSAGRTADPWIGPGILEVLPALAARGVRGVVVCPAGFVSDHLEVLYDLDIEASQLATTLHLAFARTALPNDDARFFAMLAEQVVAHLEREERRSV
ncbi:MAG TPA: ferrochelatase [Ktedonobacteraceae bacterium]|jgi:ferrochelatase